MAPKVEILPPERPRQRQALRVSEASSPRPATARVSAAPSKQRPVRQCLLCGKRGRHENEVEVGPLYTTLCEDCGDSANKAHWLMSMALSFFGRR